MVSKLKISNVKRCQKTYKSTYIKNKTAQGFRSEIQENCQISKIHCLLCQNLQYNWIEDGEKNSKKEKMTKVKPSLYINSLTNSIYKERIADSTKLNLSIFFYSQVS